MGTLRGSGARLRIFKDGDNASLLRIDRIKFRHMKDTRSQSSLKVLALSYPDLLVGKDDIIRLFGPNIANQMKVRSDTDKIIEWHGERVGSVLCEIYDTNVLFKLLGLESDYIDIVEARGIERIVDLNDPLPEDLSEQYDLILDTGTLEH